MVCTEITLTKEEYKSKDYKMSKSHKKFIRNNIKNGWSGKRLKYKAKYIPELNRLKKVCFYFEPYLKECLIYDNRPEVCRSWNCRKKDLLDNGKQVKKIWKKLLVQNATK
jgi:Fe-S-cluster containining protein